MSLTKQAQSLGGKTVSKINKEKGNLKRIEYNKNPNICLYCKSPLLVSENQSLAGIKKKKFCNIHCSVTYNNLNRICNTKNRKYPTKLDQFTDSDIIYYFNICNNKKELSSKLNCSYSSLTLSKRMKELSLNYQKNPKIFSKISNVTKKELFSSKKYWIESRSVISKNARMIYKNSNKEKYCIICQYKKTFEIAHIQSVSSFEDNVTISEINNIDNLIALCPNHHWEYDHKKLSKKDKNKLYNNIKNNT